jgi:hypothetical protein
MKDKHLEYILACVYIATLKSTGRTSTAKIEQIKCLRRFITPAPSLLESKVTIEHYFQIENASEQIVKNYHKEYEAKDKLNPAKPLDL